MRFLPIVTQIFLWYAVFDSIGAAEGDNPTEIAVTAFPWGTYLGEEALIVVDGARRFVSAEPVRADLDAPDPRVEVIVRPFRDDATDDDETGEINLGCTSKYGYGFSD